MRKAGKSYGLIDEERMRRKLEIRLPTIGEIEAGLAPCSHGVPLVECRYCPCSRCRKEFILADTENWDFPLGINCYEELGEPSREKYEKEIRPKESS